MKKVLLFLAVITFSTTLFAQSDKYVPAMKKNLAMLDSATIKGNMTELANNFERIASAEKNQWLPYYYAAYGYVMNAFNEKDKSKVDVVADKAQELIDKAEATAGKENSEIAVIKSMIASARMMVDPQSRWMQYGATSTSSREKAKALDPSNPRPYFLEGQALLYTPEAFGGGKAVAKPVFEKALAMFETFKPATELDPSWGKGATLYFIAQVSK